MKKQKAKTKKIAQKRFKITKTGKIIRRKQRLRHLRAKQSKKTIRRKKQTAQVKGRFKRTIKKLLPYGSG